MPLETATYIDDLDPANPAATDQVKQGDDHIRLIKAVLQATFPNIAGPVDLSDTDLNDLAALVGATAVPVGTIALWYGTTLTVPTGWGICNGTAYAKVDGSGNITSPDLRDKVVIGVGTLQATPGGTHGAAASNVTSGSGGAHSHTTTAGQGGHSHPGLASASHALSISEMPAHTHTVGVGGAGATNGAGGTGGTSTTLTTDSQGGGAAHSHGLTWPGTADGTHTHTTDAVADHTHSVSTSTYQPAIALHYILKL